MKVNKRVGPNTIPPKILKDYKSDFSKPLGGMINTSFTTGIYIYSPVPLKWQIFLFIRMVTSLTATTIDPYLSFLKPVIFLKKWCIFDCQVFWIKIRFSEVFSLAFEINIPQTMHALIILIEIIQFFLIGIQSMQSWTATMRHRVTRKRSPKRLEHTGNQFRKNLQKKYVC